MANPNDRPQLERPPDPDEVDANGCEEVGAIDGFANPVVANLDTENFEKHAELFHGRCSRGCRFS